MVLRAKRLARASHDVKYSSKIIKAGALLTDTKLLLRQWHEGLDVQSNLDNVREYNLFGKASRLRAEDILSDFKQRYLKDLHVLRALVTLTKGGMPAESLDRILYFQAARSDPLLHDLVTEVLTDWTARSDREVRPWEVQKWVEEKVAYTDFDMTNGGAFGFSWGFHSLLGAMYLQLAFLMPNTVGVRYCRAPNCNKILSFDAPQETPEEESERLFTKGKRKPQKRRSDKEFCNKACYMRWKRRREKLEGA
jgi:Putative inner membrane protein (DUF1819)